MIWNSTATMAAFDLLMIGITVLIFAAMRSHRRITMVAGDARGPVFMFAAVIVTAVFCVADLAIMFVLPFSVGEENAYEAMEYLHLNVRWVVTGVTGILMLVGFTRALSYRQKTAVTLGCLTSELVHCEEHERLRIASYLHDHIGQSLAALRIKIDLIFQEGSGIGQSKDKRQLTQLLEETIERTESLTYDLHPPVLSELGLSAAIEWISSIFSRDSDVRFNCIIEGTPVEIEKEDAILLYRIGRELMLNVIKHARTDRARITLRWQDDVLSMEVEDKGTGYEPNNRASTRDGLRFGLPSVRARISALGGSYGVETRLGKGTRVSLNVPLGGGEKGLTVASS